MSNNRLPRHVGFIPDGNRRWAENRGLSKQTGYEHGIALGLRLFDECKKRGIGEISIYCFTQDNTRRPTVQTEAFRAASVAFAREIEQRGAALLVVGSDALTWFKKQDQTLGG